MGKLSDTMIQCFARTKENGKLVRHRGGFWSSKDVEIKVKGRYSVPEWHFGTGTIQALISRNLLIATKSGKFYHLEVEPSKGKFLTTI